MGQENINYFEDSDPRPEKLDIKWAIIRHVDRINNLVTLTHSDRQATLGERQQLLALAVKMLEQMLTFYVDDVYTKAIADKEKETSTDKELALALFKYGELMMLLGRHGFLMRRFVLGRS